MARMPRCSLCPLGMLPGPPRTLGTCLAGRSPTLGRGRSCAGCHPRSFSLPPPPEPRGAFLDPRGRRKNVTISRSRPALLEALPSEAEGAGGVRRKEKGTSSYLQIPVDLILQSLGTVATEHPDVTLWSEMTPGFLTKTEDMPLQ